MHHKLRCLTGVPHIGKTTLIRLIMLPFNVWEWDENGPVRQDFQIPASFDGSTRLVFQFTSGTDVRVQYPQLESTIPKFWSDNLGGMICLHMEFAKYSYGGHSDFIKMLNYLAKDIQKTINKFLVGKRKTEENIVRVNTAQEFVTVMNRFFELFKKYPVHLFIDDFDMVIFAAKASEDYDTILADYRNIMNIIGPKCNVILVGVVPAVACSLRGQILHQSITEGTTKILGLPISQVRPILENKVRTIDEIFVDQMVRACAGFNSANCHPIHPECFRVVMDARNYELADLLTEVRSYRYILSYIQTNPRIHTMFVDLLVDGWLDGRMYQEMTFGDLWIQINTNALDLSGCVQLLTYLGFIRLYKTKYAIADDPSNILEILGKTDPPDHVATYYSFTNIIFYNTIFGFMKRLTVPPYNECTPYFFRLGTAHKSALKVLYSIYKEHRERNSGYNAEVPTTHVFFNKLIHFFPTYFILVQRAVTVDSTKFLDFALISTSPDDPSYFVEAKRKDKITYTAMIDLVNLGFHQIYTRQYDQFMNRIWSRRTNRKGKIYYISMAYDNNGFFMARTHERRSASRCNCEATSTVYCGEVVYPTAGDGEFFMAPDQ